MTDAAKGPAGPFYHGTKADLSPGDLISPGYRSNYGARDRTTRWVYMSEILSPWGAELARGEGRGRIYIVEPTGPFFDDPDLTDKKFPGNPTKSYRSRSPLRVIGEVTDWQGHTQDEIQAMLDRQDRLYAEQAARIARIPGDEDVRQAHAQADGLAHEAMPEATYAGCTVLMLVRGTDVQIHWAMTYHSPRPPAIRVIELPEPSRIEPAWSAGDVPLSGRLTEVTAWHEGWAVAIESCITEIGLSTETRVWVAVDAEHDTLIFRVDSDGPERSWQRNLRLVEGVLCDDEYGEVWDHKTEGQKA